ncbi:hypothetical protein Hanom_Chr12g01121391 [Helianthus anomalus]
MQNTGTNYVINSFNLHCFLLYTRFLPASRVAAATSRHTRDDDDIDVWRATRDM